MIQAWISGYPSALGPACDERIFRAKAQKPDGSASPRDEVSATDVDLLGQPYVAFEEATDPRAERVAELRKQVRSGTYEIPLPQLVRILADLILRRR
jgi:anti-sigma28 factor (negative regulator of flagellin synthesis)